MRGKWGDSTGSRLVLLLAISSSVLYACLLPLWEGFDEPFHYAYVQSLSVEHRIPILGRNRVSEEIGRSLELVPLSHIAARSIPKAITFDAWFALPESERLARIWQLAGISPELRNILSPRPNYEAHHPPLAYALLAPIDLFTSGLPLRLRVLLIRLAFSVCSAAFLFIAGRLLCNALGLAAPFRLATLVCIFQSQMLWASVAHIANDWLAIPVAAALIAMLVLFIQRGGPAHAFLLGGLLSIGLLTKAYFLVFVPIVAAALVWNMYRSRIRLSTALLSLAVIAAVGGWWYLRNWTIYGNISGTQEAFGGIGFRQVWDAAPKVDWLKTAGFMARSSLWTGNNSFTTFSRSTLNFELLLLAVAFLLYFAHYRSIKASEGWGLAAIGTFILALAYATCASWAYNKGEVPGASPWYAQVLLAPVLAVVFLALQRSTTVGPVLALLSVIVSGWIYALTYFGKLFPLYSGYEAGRSTVHDLLSWWLRDPRTHAGLLSSTALAPAGILYALALFIFALQILLTSRLFVSFVQLFRGKSRFRSDNGQHLRSFNLRLRSKR